MCAQGKCTAVSDNVMMGSTAYANCIYVMVMKLVVSAVMCGRQECGRGYWRCKDGSRCLRNEYVCDGDIQVYDTNTCPDKSDENATMCAQWKCIPGYIKCKDGLQCIHDIQMCTGHGTECRDKSDEDPIVCRQYQCIKRNIYKKPRQYTQYIKCADNLQCIPEENICNGLRDRIWPDCLDGSDELCEDCWDGVGEKAIMKRCPEDPGKCIPVKQYCDGIAHCPDGGDEAQSNCTCEDWGLIPCKHRDNGQIKCFQANWTLGQGLHQIYEMGFECPASLHNTYTSLKQINNTGIIPFQSVTISQEVSLEG